MTKVAFIGLGVMGYPMAGYLAKAGNDVSVYNRTTAKAEKWVAEYGGIACDTPKAAADGAEFVMACLLYTSPSPRDQRGSRMPSSA